MIVATWDRLDQTWEDDYSQITEEGTFAFDVKIGDNEERSFSAYVDYKPGERKISTPMLYEKSGTMYCLILTVHKGGQIGHNLYNVGNPNLSVYDSVAIKWRRIG